MPGIRIGHAVPCHRRCVRASTKKEVGMRMLLLRDQSRRAYQIVVALVLVVTRPASKTTVAAAGRFQSARCAAQAAGVRTIARHLQRVGKSWRCGMGRERNRADAPSSTRCATRHASRVVSTHRFNLFRVRKKDKPRSARTDAARSPLLSPARYALTVRSIEQIRSARSRRREGKNLSQRPHELRRLTRRARSSIRGGASRSRPSRPEGPPSIFGIAHSASYTRRRAAATPPKSAISGGRMLSARAGRD